MVYGVSQKKHALLKFERVLRLVIYFPLLFFTCHYLSGNTLYTTYPHICYF